MISRFLSRLLIAVPRSLLRILGASLGILWFDILRLRRKVVLDNMDIAFPEKDRAWKVRTARTALCRFGSNFAEFFVLPSLDEAWVKKNVVVHGMDLFEKAKEKNKGVFLLSLHMGAYDIAASLMPMRGHETYLISKFFKTKWFNDMWFAIRAAKGMKFIEPHGEKTAFEILKGLKRNAGVIFVLDQFMGRPFGIPTTFFGRDTATAYGLALFVLKTGAPVVPVYSYEGSDGKLHLVYEPEVETASEIVTDNKDESIRRLTEKFNRVLEAIIRKHPEEWLWVHRRWKEYE